MTRKRKRCRREQFVERESKRLRTSEAVSIKDGPVKQNLLSQYYLKVLTLRNYLLSKLPASSKHQRKKILAINQRDDTLRVDAEAENNLLARHLDQTLVGIQKGVPLEDGRWEQWTIFSQRAEDSETTAKSVDCGGGYCQSEIVDFTIWQMFKHSSKSGSRPQHLLCQGFRKEVNFSAIDREENPITAIPGIASTYPNNHVSMLKGSPWPQILSLLGREGQRVMIDLIMDCGIFIAIRSGNGNYSQLSGMPLGDLQILPAIGSNSDSKALPGNLRRPCFPNRGKGQCLADIRSPSRIVFVRNRILYARAALNRQGNVQFGLRHIHVLNRYGYEFPKQPWEATRHIRQQGTENSEKLNFEDERRTIHTMMYIFPREFALHNVFTSFIDSRETVQPLKDYTIREDEIASKYQEKLIHHTKGARVKVPKRLRGEAGEFVRRLRLSHSRCSYEKLLNHYCPIPGSNTNDSMMRVHQTLQDESTAFDTQINGRPPGRNVDLLTVKSEGQELPTRKPTLMDHATSTAGVSAFCRSVLSTLIPSDFWGGAESQTHNKDLFMKAIDRFITLRRFETLSLHDVCQGMQIRNISWLGSQYAGNARMSQSDVQKRIQLFHEFVYYAFDSLLIPIIRSHFFVTDSNVKRNCVFFFRQDVWRSLCEPQLLSLKRTMLDEMSLKDAQSILDNRSLGFSHLRLLPKEIGVRPIMNLRRRPLKRGHKKMLGSSINSILAPIHNMYTYEKNINPDRLGASIFCLGDLHNRLRQFGKALSKSSKPLFFAKVDVQSAFDTIPQSAILRVMQNLPTESEYRISRYAEIKPGETYWADASGHTKSKPIRKWISLATSRNDFHIFEQSLENTLAIGRKNTVFVENVVSQFRDVKELLDLLSQHIQHNMVKIGKKFYRQKNGIPQGSVLSSILCNYFYADLETHNLGFLQGPNSILLRLVDDFLLITTERRHAKAFLQVMHDGVPTYGVTVNPAKTLANFEVSINNVKVTRLVGTRKFPYCGNLIDTKTLDVTKDRNRRKHMAIADTLTVEYSRRPGKTFHRKVLNAFKLQAQAIFTDTSFNSFRIVLANLDDSLVETAVKVWRYAKCLPLPNQPRPSIVQRTIQDLIKFAFILIKSKGSKKGNEKYHCSVTKIQVEWLVLNAFRSVLHVKQAKYLAVVAWLDSRIQALRDKKAKECAYLERVIGRRTSAWIPVN